jgi:hypothetical protein
MDVKTVSKPVIPSTPAPKRASEQSQAAAQENRPQTNEARRDNPPKPNPVVNTQGQVTGRHLNVTA